MRIRSAASLAALALLGPAIAEVAAQQKFRLGGGAGFAVLYNPEIEHGRTAVVGGSLGFRFNDNLSFETGFSFARSHRQFSEFGVPIDEQQGGIPAFEFDANRYHLDGSVLVHFGRRVPFHPYVIGGGGLVRRDEMQTDFTYTLGENGEVLDRTEEVSLDTSEYEPTAHLGAGFDLYFLYNVAARVEFRWWLPTTTDKSTRMFFFGASYFF
ncbi:MAG TPA: outer membrane beta-barrel protein [Vicinamibacteria bacterium]|nr:outer membrane beta-barrel protein [Vicinamibacteria bacterium]